MEFVNATKISPLISKVLIKVCYVGQDPNRNGTVITKEVATKLGENLPGTPIVGYYNEKTSDFDAHTRDVVIEGGKFKMVDMTKPYGFVDVGAKVWFQKFKDDGQDEREYLCTEGYIWNKIYEESQRIVDQGNNQSMELNDEYEKGFWTKDSNSGRNIFIISDGLIEKLCILGSDIEPCFEGAQIKSFSLTGAEFEEFKTTMFSMINELKETLKGGSKETMDNEKDVVIPSEEEESTSEFEKKKENPEEEKETSKETEEQNKEPEEEEDDKKDKKKYNLEEIPEYVTLQSEYNDLQTKYSTLEQQNQTMVDELNQLRSFKLAAERKDKEAMVDSFYMLSDDDKKDVVDNLDKYSLEEIEGKLAIICVRNKVDFNLADEKHDDAGKQQYTLNLNNIDTHEDDNVPAWVKAVCQNS